MNSNKRSTSLKTQILKRFVLKRKNKTARIRNHLNNNKRNMMKGRRMKLKKLRGVGPSVNISVSP